MDLLLALIELSVVFCFAGWVTYLQKEKGAFACGGPAGLAPRLRTTRRALRRHNLKVMVTRGQTASEAAGAAVDYS